MRRIHGFTIVELLIVIVVVGILAAISIVAYNGVSNSAHDAAVKQDMRNVAQLLDIYKAGAGVYPTNLHSLASAGPIKVTKNSYDLTGIHTTGQFNFLYCRPTDSLTEFGLIAKSRSGKTFQFVQGTLSDFVGLEPRGANVLCNSIGIPTTASSPSWTWLYNSGAWSSEVGS